MIHSESKLEGFVLHATDGEIGRVRDLYFDDRTWAVRYMVVETGGWLTGRWVLISPLAISAANWQTRKIDVALTCDQIKHSPDIDTAKPVSRQQESDLNRYYNYSWVLGMDPSGISPVVPLAPADPPADVAADKAAADPHLRSAHDVRDYHIRASDGVIGHVADFLVDEEGWKIGRLLVNTSNWWKGKSVVVPLDRVLSIDWAEHDVAVSLTRAEIAQGPEFRADAATT